MIKLKGKAVFGGIAWGRLQFYHREESVVERKKIDNADIELKRYEYAKDCAVNELTELYELAVNDIGKHDAEIFIIQQMLIKDEDFDSSVKELIRDCHYSADFAVAKTARDCAQAFGKVDYDYIKERAADIKDVSERLIRHIQNKAEASFKVTDKTIICADDLVPSETVRLDKSKVLAFATCYGSSNSHTAILAKTMNIPAIIGAGKALSESYDGRLAVIDGYEGCLYIDPDEETNKMLLQKQEAEAKKRELLKRFKGRRNITLDGTEIQVFSNIGGLSDIDSVIENDSGGIGLFRSEFIYLKSSHLPDEETQFYNYRCVLERMNGKKVIVRTLDVGADKNIKYFGLATEQNPALGLRSIRLCLERPEMFKTQLRALLRASVYGKLAIMFPMISDATELRRARELLEDAKGQLRAKNQKYSDSIEVGIMIETPAAAIMSDELAKEVDFFSIGTNDLEQYVLAIDRQNLQLESYYPNNTHKPLLRLMRFVCENARKNGIWVGTCGELGADLTLTEEFLRMGIDEISVPPSQTLPLRKRIRSINLLD